MADQTLQRINDLANYLSAVPIRVDCFFVTAARLFRTTPHEIAIRIDMPVPTPGTRGLDTAHILTALQRLDLNFKSWAFQGRNSGGGGPIRNPEGRPEAMVPANLGMPSVVGVAYRRPDRTGHVVICKNPASPHRTYVDYQASPNGTNVTEDVRRSRIVVYFAVDPASRGLDQRHRQGIEHMEVDPQDDEPMEWENAGGDEPMEH
ncbi:hypothetical protein ASPWEDRAFT_169917 [Aspergillus wentii DTO 134E9]|uniref:Uncharacterized protein n=1 Tax=Aspergillus wentii DTO 134E9 TaxID=1073089 RepID=A0A1L9RNC8_ASPWE|nr:uncharacterized protein ASPWEDRAFT_169917 [Aspergillus wentii DTO 134E9]KAI9926050.1 hypothetical protein MW887_004509 [Aspergillus wentii]OJJ36393.1 hypothetical protein ASPWEDRAFT_169917 [Aspergillus wentii DTO 134E9]